jgi:hypothetical protein
MDYLYRLNKQTKDLHKQVLIPSTRKWPIKSNPLFAIAKVCNDSMTWERSTMSLAVANWGLCKLVEKNWSINTQQYHVVIAEYLVACLFVSFHHFLKLTYGITTTHCYRKIRNALTSCKLSITRQTWKPGIKCINQHCWGKYVHLQKWDPLKMMNFVGRSKTVYCPTRDV